MATTAVVAVVAVVAEQEHASSNAPRLAIPACVVVDEAVAEEYAGGVHVVPHLDQRCVDRLC